MAFTPAVAKVPMSIGNIEIKLKDAVATDEEEAYQSVAYDVIIKYSDGFYEHRRGNLVPHLTPAQITGLQSFMADMRVKAKEEFLPGG